LRQRYISRILKISVGTWGLQAGGFIKMISPRYQNGQKQKGMAMAPLLETQLFRDTEIIGWR